jgi:beta-phosphoglucomutase
MPDQLGVIFDVDGVLVDSYDAHYKSWQMLARERGFEMTEEQFVRTFGRTSREVIRKCWPPLATSDEAVKELDERKEALYRELLRQNFSAMDGARELIDALSATGFALAVGSSGPPSNVELTLEQLGRRDSFRAVVTGQDVKFGKPNPQVFQIGAERLGLPPSQCLVVEDAPAGVAAAHAGGFVCLGLLSKGGRGDQLNQAERVVHTLRDVTPDLVAELIQQGLRKN